MRMMIKLTYYSKNRRKWACYSSYTPSKELIAEAFDTLDLVKLRIERVKMRG